MAEGIVPARYIDDGNHIAYAVFARLDAVVSWNLKHIVRMRVRKQIRKFNERHGYHVLNLASPAEIIQRT